VKKAVSILTKAPTESNLAIHQFSQPTAVNRSEVNIGI
jgi:hypothetical protein